LAAFVVIETRSAHPLLPLRILIDRNRGGSYVSSLLVGIAMFATFLFLTYYFQGTLHYSAIRSGFAFLPFSVGIITGATLASRFLPRVGPRALMVAGFALAALGLFLFTMVHPDSAYFAHLFPAELIVSIGMGTSFVPLSSTALIGVNEADAGVASALVNTTQQTGGTLGVSLLNTVAASATTAYLVGRVPGAATRAAAVVHGYTTAFTISAALLAGAALVAFLMLRGAPGATSDETLLGDPDAERDEGPVLADLDAVFVDQSVASL
jgi:MFS family permease